MPTLDTNVLIRYLVQDDARQARAAFKYISRYANTEGVLFLPVSVVLETEWVLRSAYGYAKDSVIHVFVSLLETRELAFQDEASLEFAIFLYREHNIDFADCLHLATAHTHNELPLVTFDRRAAKLEGTEGVG